jgi:hypothetical protein
MGEGRVSFFAVFDGHGGVNVATSASEELHKHVLAAGLVSSWSVSAQYHSITHKYCASQQCVEVADGRTHCRRGAVAQKAGNKLFQRDFRALMRCCWKGVSRTSGKMGPHAQRPGFLETPSLWQT